MVEIGLCHFGFYKNKLKQKVGPEIPLSLAWSTKPSRQGLTLMPPLCSHAGGTCVRRCGPGFYGNPEVGECEPCHPACKSCVGLGPHQCSSCQEGLQLQHGTCVGPAQPHVEGKFWNGMCLPRKREVECEQVSGYLLCLPPPTLTLAFGISQRQRQGSEPKLRVGIQFGQDWVGGCGWLASDLVGNPSTPFGWYGQGVPIRWRRPRSR